MPKEIMNLLRGRCKESCLANYTRNRLTAAAAAAASVTRVIYWSYGRIASSLCIRASDTYWYNKHIGSSANRVDERRHSCRSNSSDRWTRRWPIATVAVGGCRLPRWVGYVRWLSTSWSSSSYRSRPKSNSQMRDNQSKCRLVERFSLRAHVLQ